MDITFARCEQILNTLPIGYYAGRKVKTELKDGVSTSYYSPMEDSIVISYPLIKEGVSKVTDESKIESVVRSMMYHELSHAILTPEHLKITQIVKKNAFNIFEDERIETLLRNYYYGVNFRKQIYDLNGGVHTPTDAMSAFFNIVRFGVGPKRFTDRVSQIIKKFSKVNRNADYYEVSNYTWHVWDLYEDVARDYPRNPEDYKPQNGESDTDAEGNSQPQEGDSREMEQEDGRPELASIITDDQHEISNTLEEIRELIAEGLDITSRLNKGQKDKLEDFKRSAELIISNFNKKNYGGSGINTYSGVFNPRAMSRQDYRYFERSMSVQGNNKFGTCHLNLFIDCSGSFYNSEPLVNGMLAALSEIERKNKNFSMDVLFCGVGVYKCQNKKERQIKCDGGNNLPDDMKQIFLEVQKPNTCNYNIVLFDGDAFSDYTDGDKSTRCTKVFSAFDYKQTTLVTDSDNVRYLGSGGFKASKVIVTDQYTHELINHVLKALTVAFG